MDVLTVLMEAKRLGLDLTQLFMFGTVYLLLRRDLVKVMDRQFDKLIMAINLLEKAHNERLNKLEAHIGLKKEE